MNVKKCLIAAASAAVLLVFSPVAAHADTTTTPYGEQIPVTAGSSAYWILDVPSGMSVESVSAPCDGSNQKTTWNYNVGSCTITILSSDEIYIQTWAAGVVVAGAFPNFDLTYTVSNGTEGGTEIDLVKVTNLKPLKVVRSRKHPNLLFVTDPNSAELDYSPAVFTVDNQNGNSAHYYAASVAVLPQSTVSVHVQRGLAKLKTAQLSWSGYSSDLGTTLAQHNLSAVPKG